MSIRIKSIYRADDRTASPQPVYVAKVSAGFPSPADDYQEGKLDLNKYLIRNQAATFFVRVTGNSMINAGIHDGDMLVVDRSLEAVNRSVVIAAIDGELTVKRLMKYKNKLILEPENEEYAPQEIHEDMDFQIWGVVTNVIHKL